MTETSGGPDFGLPLVFFVRNGTSGLALRAVASLLRGAGDKWAAISPGGSYHPQVFPVAVGELPGQQAELGGDSQIKANPHPQRIQAQPDSQNV